MKRFIYLALVLSIMMSLILTGCGTKEDQVPVTNDATNSGETITIRVATVGSETHAYVRGLRIMEAELKEKSNGRIKLEVFTDGSLGNEREIIEGVKMGSIDMGTVTADGALPSWVPETQVLSVPYLFSTADEAYDVLDNFLIERLEPKFNEQGMTNLGFLELGFRHFTNNKAPINNASDMKGMVIRVQEAPIWFALINSVGGTPQPINFNELYSAMQQGVVDGQENPLSTIVSQKYYEVQKYMTLDKHTYAAGAVIFNKAKFDSLSAEDQSLIRDVVSSAVSQQRQMIQDLDVEYIQTCKESGMQIVENPDIESFQIATSSISSLDEVKGLFDVSIIDEIKNYLSN